MENVMNLSLPSLKALSIPAVLLLPALAACHHSSSSQAVPGVAAADLAGVWAYNPEASDQPGRPGGSGGMPGGRGGMGGRGGGRGGMGGRGGGGGGGGIGGGEGGAPGGRRAPGDTSMARAPQQIIIVQTDSTVTFTVQGKSPLTLYFDGGVVQLPGEAGYGRVQAAGHWHDKKFVVERRMGSTTVTESYERSSDRTKLTVRTRTADNFGEGSEIKRVYDWVARPQ
jgi:hypothetical protein